jgi:hypothetical protein
MGAAATLFGGGTAQALGAAITGVAGADAAFDKNVYFEKSMVAILSKMVAMRKQVLVRMRAGLGRTDSQYPLTRALVDLEDYYISGTIPGAIIAIAETAGAESNKADEKLEAIEIRRELGFSTQTIRDRIREMLTKIEALSSGDALILANAPPVNDNELVKGIFADLFPNKEWLTEPDSAKESLRVRVTYGDRSEADLRAWESKLGIPN